jgi:hypothetical protein
LISFAEAWRRVGDYYVYRRRYHHRHPDSYSCISVAVLDVNTIAAQFFLQQKYQGRIGQKSLEQNFDTAQGLQGHRMTRELTIYRHLIFDAALLVSNQKLNQ